jgi:hypothetical protein
MAAVVKKARQSAQRLSRPARPFPGWWGPASRRALAAPTLIVRAGAAVFFMAEVAEVLPDAPARPMRGCWIG